jgi:hypothetical protein
VPHPGVFQILARLFVVSWSPSTLVNCSSQLTFRDSIVHPAELGIWDVGTVGGSTHMVVRYETEHCVRTLVFHLVLG